MFFSMIRHFRYNEQLIRTALVNKTPHFNSQPTTFSICKIPVNANKKLCLILLINKQNGELAVNMREQQQQKHDYDSTSIWIPIEQVRQLTRRLHQLKIVNFDVDKNGIVGLDRIKEFPMANGIYQRLYTHRLPAFLQSARCNVFFLSMIYYRIDLSAYKKTSPTISLMNHEREIFISELQSIPNKFHAWRPIVHSLQFPTTIVPSLVQQLGNLLAHPVVKQWDKQQLERQQSKQQACTNSTITATALNSITKQLTGNEFLQNDYTFSHDNCLAPPPEYSVELKLPVFRRV